MVEVRVIHSELKRRFNRVSSNAHEDISVEHWDMFFNEGYRTWVKNRVAIAKTNSKVRYDIRKLNVKNHEVDILKRDNHVIAILPSDYYDLQMVVPIAIKEGCRERPLITHMVQGNDMAETSKDPFWSPSFLWARTLADEGSEGLHILTGDFSIKKVFIDYYKQPRGIISRSLKVGCDYDAAFAVLGSGDVNFELDEMQMDEICDAAVAAASSDTGNYQGAQAIMSKVVNSQVFPNNKF